MTKPLSKPWFAGQLETAEWHLTKVCVGSSVWAGTPGRLLPVSEPLGQGVLHSPCLSPSSAKWPLSWRVGEIPCVKHMTPCRALGCVGIVGVKKDSEPRQVPLQSGDSLERHEIFTHQGIWGLLWRCPLLNYTPKNSPPGLVHRGLRFRHIHPQSRGKG